MTFAESTNIREQAIQLFKERGWKDNDILIEPSHTVDGKLYRPDFIILLNNYPIAIIEIANVTDKDLTKAQAQASYYLENIDVPLAYVIGHDQIIEIQPILDTPIKLRKFPSPEDILKKLGIEKDNPLVLPLPQTKKRPSRLFQAFAIRNTIQAIQEGKKRVLVLMVVGSGSSYVIMQVIGKLIRSKKYNRALYISDRIVLLKQSQNIFKEHGFSTQIIENRAKPNKTEIHFQSVQSLTREIEKPDKSMYDLVIFDNANVALRINSFDEIFPNAAIIGFSSLNLSSHKALNFYGEPVYTFSIKDTLSVEEITPKEGFSRVQLSDIGEITSGVSYRKENFLENASDTKAFILLRGKDIDVDGNTAFESAVKINPDIETYFIEDKQIRDKYQLHKGDILLQAITSGKFRNVSLVREEPDTPATFSSSLIRIRINNPNIALPKDVYAYLRSTEGQQMLKRLEIRGTTIPRISPRDLMNFPILLPNPELQIDEYKKGEDIFETIREKITDIIDQVEIDNDEDNPEVINEHLSLVTEKILSVVTNLTPPSIHDIVLDSFPTPIAIAYRRYHDARFNVYEQLVRLRDLYEAIAFFIYNTIFADWIYRLGNNYSIKDKGASKAYSQHSMHARIKFVDEIIKAAKTRKKNELFLSELQEAEYSSLAFLLQSEFRNFFSHHGLGTEIVVKNSINKFWPMVEELLVELKFLSNYRMARITEIYSHKKSIIQRMELYRGPVPEIEEIPVEQEIIPSLPDKEHLVLLDQDNQSLSLYPIYQLFFNKETRYEKHIGFIKQVKGVKILGESVQGAFPVVLDGFQELQALVKNAKSPKTS
ncbi:MAG: DEAD/DEAH box helicase family protein [Anaerolineales bacterium]|nr:DEAD/DEAH box helicase family protein [Chloroflexota bacterium]MBL6982137.1 DEAD/DEAH box helicase family protein [Anaerolineales bacterium]